MTGISIGPELLDKVRAVTSRPGWSAETVTVFTSPYRGVRLISGPMGRGIPRRSFLIVAPTTADAFRCLVECLALIDAEAGQ